MPRPKLRREALQPGNVIMVHHRGAILKAITRCVFTSHVEAYTETPRKIYTFHINTQRDVVRDATFATLSQHMYDVRVEEARTYVRDVAGLDLRGRSPFGDPDMLLALADVLRPMIDNGEQR
ncbi:MAG: hypothetical protein REI11_18960 [Patulibacter sp.]|nr:hypothetical protein [Patulibacter sp.]